MTDETSRQPKRKRRETVDDAETPQIVSGAGPTAAAEALAAAEVDAAAEALAAVEAAAVSSGQHPDPGLARDAATASVTLSPPASQPIGRTILQVQQGGLGEVTADEVQVQMGGIGALQAERVDVTLGGIGAARADTIAVRFGSIGASLANEVHVSQGAAGGIVARHAHVEQSLVRTLVAKDVHFARPSAVLVLLAARVGGDVRALIDWRAALAFGAAFGLVAGLAGRLGRRR